MELLPALNAFTVFLAIAAVGFLFLMVSLFFGEIFEHFDTSLDHDLDHGGPSFFSPRVMSVFVTTFGGAGAIATFYRWSPVPASLAGFVSGLALSSLVLVFARFLYRQQASSDMRATDLVGQAGRVVVAIPAGGVGQVRCRVGEELVDKIAQARDGALIPENAAVRIEEVLGETVIVIRQ
ncbi:MAG TPA: NfeD family protein [Vicinamibacterales bacterium]|nr:NfeD family protein [Vicinamibacterales bacterium]